MPATPTACRGASRLRPSPDSIARAGNADLLQPGCRRPAAPAVSPAPQAISAGGLRAASIPRPPFGVVNFGAAAVHRQRLRNIARLLGVTGSLNGVGLDDRYNQKSNNWALFTHNIFPHHRQFEADGRRSLHARAARNSTAISTDNNIALHGDRGIAFLSAPAAAVRDSASVPGGNVIGTRRPARPRTSSPGRSCSATSRPTDC